MRIQLFAAIVIVGFSLGFSGSATFTMTMPNGSMMTATCSAIGTGTFDLDDLMIQMHGTYAGSNSCSGPFDHGQMFMSRR